jgi:hypothetical protein
MKVLEEKLHLLSGSRDEGSGNSTIQVQIPALSPPLSLLPETGCSDIDGSERLENIIQGKEVQLDTPDDVQDSVDGMGAVVLDENSGMRDHGYFGIYHLTRAPVSANRK